MPRDAPRTCPETVMSRGWSHASKGPCDERTVRRSRRLRGDFRLVTESSWLIDTRRRTAAMDVGHTTSHAKLAAVDLELFAAGPGPSRRHAEGEELIPATTWSKE